MVLSAASDEAATTDCVRRIGPALVFERLWQETGCRAAITELTGKRKHGFALERAVFLTVLHRLFVSGSDRAADRWREDYALAGVEGLDLHHLYRAMAWLGEQLPAEGARRPHAARAALREGRRWRNGCSHIDAICSRGWIWCSWTPPACTSKAPVARR